MYYLFVFTLYQQNETTMNDLKLILNDYLEGKIKFSQMYEAILLTGHKIVCFQRYFGKTLLKVKDSEGNLICINPDEKI